jgi:hypothetical protein
MSAPSVYAAINSVTAELATSGIAKNRTNEVDDYKYRSIDDVLDRLAPLLARHRLCVLPRSLERIVTERSDEQDRLLLHAALRVSFTLISVDDGSSHVVEAYGEALDGGDKATAKAMSAAFKTAMVQTFCIPVCGGEEADRTSHRLTRRTHIPEPPQGWTQWCLDIEDMVVLCETEQAISTVQERYRDLLKAVAREQPSLYAQLGQAFVSRREALASKPSLASECEARGERKTSRSKSNGRHAQEVEHA